MDPKPFICAHDLKEKEQTVTIDRVVRGEIMGEKGRKSKKPACYFRSDKEKRPLFLNVTNCRTLANMTGSEHIEDWAGWRITIFPTTTQDKDGKTVACIRIHPRGERPEQRQTSSGAGRNDRPPTNERPATNTNANQDPDPLADSGSRQPGDD